MMAGRPSKGPEEEGRKEGGEAARRGCMLEARPRAKGVEQVRKGGSARMGERGGEGEGINKT